MKGPCSRRRPPSVCACEQVSFDCKDILCDAPKRPCPLNYPPLRRLYNRRADTKGQQVTLPCYLCADREENHSLTDSAPVVLSQRIRGSAVFSGPDYSDPLVRLFSRGSQMEPRHDLGRVESKNLDGDDIIQECIQVTNIRVAPPPLPLVRELEPVAHPGLPAVEPAGRHAGQRRPQRGGGGGLHKSPGAAAGLHQVPLQPGHQLH